MPFIVNCPECRAELEFQDRNDRVTCVLCDEMYYYPKRERRSYQQSSNELDNCRRCMTMCGGECYE